MNISSFKIVKVVVLGFPLGSFEKKCYLDVTRMENQNIYHREGSDASSQRLQPV
jgi:hypothetical protein